MSVLSRTRPRIPKPLAIGLGVFGAVAVLLVAGWALWGLFGPGPNGYSPTSGQALEVAGQPPNVFQYTIDARRRSDWAYFSFSRGTAVATSQVSLDWDLAFRRTDLLTNGGETNPASHGGAFDFGDVPLGESQALPADSYLADTTHEERGLENPALHGWYSYDWIKHVVSSKGHTYGVTTATGETASVIFLSYYCDDGSAGCITFQYLYPVSLATSSGES